MISVGQNFPEYSKVATVSIQDGKEFATITNQDHIKAKKWLVMFRTSRRCRTQIGWECITGGAGWGDGGRNRGKNRDFGLYLSDDSFSGIMGFKRTLKLPLFKR